MQIYFSVVREADATTPSPTSEGGATWLDGLLHYVVCLTELTSEFNRFICSLLLCFREVQDKNALACGFIVPTHYKWIFRK